MRKGLTVLDQYFNVMCLFSFQANDSRLQWKKKNEVRLEKALDNATSFFFSGPKLPYITTTKPPPILTHCLGRKCCMPVEIFS